MIWLDFLANPAIGNLLILIAAIVGVGGSYWVYHVRLEDQRNSARQAIKSELESITFLTKWIEKSDGIPQHSISTTVAYEAHAENIGLLTDTEIDKLTFFYSSVILLDDIIESNREIVLQTGIVPNVVDKGRADREEVISSRLDQLAVKRWQTIQILNKNLDEPYESPEKLDLPKSAGETLHKKHPTFRSYGEMLLSKGYIEQIEDKPDMYRLTDNGENHFKEITNKEMGF